MILNPQKGFTRECKNISTNICIYTQLTYNEILTKVSKRKFSPLQNYKNGQSVREYIREICAHKKVDIHTYVHTQKYIFNDGKNNNRSNKKQQQKDGV